MVTDYLSQLDTDAAAIRKAYENDLTAPKPDDAKGQRDYVEEFLSAGGDIDGVMNIAEIARKAQGENPDHPITPRDVVNSIYHPNAQRIFDEDVLQHIEDAKATYRSSSRYTINEKGQHVVEGVPEVEPNNNMSNPYETIYQRPNGTSANETGGQRGFVDEDGNFIPERYETTPESQPKNLQKGEQPDLSNKTPVPEASSGIQTDETYRFADGVKLDLFSTSPDNVNVIAEINNALQSNTATETTVQQKSETPVPQHRATHPDPAVEAALAQNDAIFAQFKKDDMVKLADNKNLNHTHIESQPIITDVPTSGKGGSRDFA